jgi:hypothetical protein
MRFADGQQYEGEWEHNQPHGKLELKPQVTSVRGLNGEGEGGSIRSADGQQYARELEHTQPHGAAAAAALLSLHRWLLVNGLRFVGLHCMLTASVVNQLCCCCCLYHHQVRAAGSLLTG